jgi:hypothetical protein
MDRLIDLSLAGIERLGAIQREVLGPTMAEVEAALGKADRTPAEPKPEGMPGEGRDDARRAARGRPFAS